MPTDFASIFGRETEVGVQLSNHELAEPRSISGAFSAPPLFRQISESGWRLLFGKLVAWLRNNHAEMIMAIEWLHRQQEEKNTAIYQEALRRESAGLPPRWR